MPQFNLFGEIDEAVKIEIPEPEPIQAPKRLRRIIGDKFVIVKCLNCSQLIMVDPEYYPLDEYKDKICEGCNNLYAAKYLKFLKMKL
jgi:hypothetical protein